jgi:N-acetylmuramoyl-L-alanine amidase
LRGLAFLLPLLDCRLRAPALRDRAAMPLWHPSPNFDQRRPNFVILHQTTNATVDRALATLTDPARKVSAHYLIGRDGTVLQLVDEAARVPGMPANRAGAA